jgi:phosphate transport system permease protein
MTATMDRPAPSMAPKPVDLRSRRSWRSTKSQIMTVLMFFAFVLVVLPLGAVLFTVVTKGIGIVLSDFPAWFTDNIPIRSRAKGPGMAPAIVGTVLITLAATLMAVPLGILGAVYLHEYGRTNAFARFLRFMTNVMTGVPSIVMGLFVYIVYTLRFGLAGFGGSIALACLMLPVIIRSSEEMLRLVPNHLREASYALGTTKARTIVTVVLPAASAGIVSGSLLAVARAAGETAPLLFTIGAATKINTNIFSGANTALATQIFNNAVSPFAGAQERAWGAALTLVAISFLVTVIARVVTSRFALKR